MGVAVKGQQEAPYGDGTIPYLDCTKHPGSAAALQLQKMLLLREIGQRMHEI